MGCKRVPWLVFLLLAGGSLAWPQHAPRVASSAGISWGTAKPFSADHIDWLLPLFSAQRLDTAQPGDARVHPATDPFGQPRPVEEPASGGTVAAGTTAAVRPSRLIGIQEAPEPVGGVLGSRQLYAVAQGSFFSAAAFDLGLTASGLHHPAIMHLTVAGNGPTHYVDIDESSRFSEVGWAHVFGAHNTPAILAAYAAEDMAIFYVVHRFVVHHPRWRMLGTMALLAQTWVHIQAGRTWIGLGQRLEAPYQQFNPVWVRH